MDLMNTLPKMHGYIISRIETDKEIKKNVYDDYVDEIQIIFIEINTTAAFIPKYKEKFVNLYLDYIQYEKNLRSLVVATIANNEELEKGKELVEANPEDLKDVAEELKVLADLREKKGNRKSSRHLSETSFFIKSFLMSRDAVEQEYDELMDKSIELYQEVDNSLFNAVRNNGTKRTNIIVKYETLHGKYNKVIGIKFYIRKRKSATDNDFDTVKINPYNIIDNEPRSEKENNVTADDFHRGYYEQKKKMTREELEKYEHDLSEGKV